MNPAARIKPSWTNVKVRLQEIDKPGLLSLLQDLYAASKDNQAFLHARLSVRGDVLKAYKDVIDRWLWPDGFKRQDTSVSKAKRAITDYKKAVGLAAGLAELSVYFCERAAGFARDAGLQDESFLDALVRMFHQAVLATLSLPVDQQEPFLARIEVVRQFGRELGYGVGDEMDDLMTRHVDS